MIDIAKRERWPSRTAFILAAIGSAVGLGNIWRYPFLAHKYGGGAFLLPYLIALFLTGIPLLILEFGLGQRMQKGAVDSFAAIKRRLSGVGWAALITSFIVITYYVVVMSWAVIYFFESFSLGWGSDTEAYFYNTVLQSTSGIDVIGSVVPVIFIALLASWIAIYFCIWKGVDSLSKVVMWAVPAPMILIVALSIRAVTLPGALGGIALYLRPDFSALLDPEIWAAAVSQIFFSLSLAFGIMIAYASYNKKNQDVVEDAFAVGIADSVIAILAGFIVFGTLGFMAQQQGIAFDEVAVGGPGLAFVVFPKALSFMPFASLFGILFFLTLVLLAIASAFSLVEAVTTTIEDKTKKIKREVISLIVCLVGFLGGIIYTTGAGIYFIDLFDHFLTHYSLIIVGILECVAVGWIYGAEKLRKYINKVSKRDIGKWWNVVIKYVIPILLIFVLILQVKEELGRSYGGYPSWAIMLGWALVIGTFVVAFLIPQKKVKVPRGA